MFNWIVRRDESRLNPIKTMMGSHFDKIFEDFDKFFEDPFFKDSNLVFNPRGSDFPKVNIIDDGDKFIVTAAVAGFSKEDLAVEYDTKNGILTIASNTGAKKETVDDNRRFISREISQRSFIRKFPFNGLVEGQPNAELKDGILTIALNKTKKKEEPKTTVNVDIK